MADRKVCDLHLLPANREHYGSEHPDSGSNAF